MMNDHQLKYYIDQVFGRFDTNRNGYLEFPELCNFYNEMLAQSGSPHRMSQQQAVDTMRMIDVDGNGGVTKQELFLGMKRMQQSPQYQTQMYPNGFRAPQIGQPLYQQPQQQMMYQQPQQPVMYQQPQPVMYQQPQQQAQQGPIIIIQQ